MPCHPPKNRQNMAKHGVSFEALPRFGWQDALTKVDTRFDYGEARYISYGMLDGRLHCLVWTVRDGVLRPISLRKANKREVTRHEREQDA